METVIPGFPIHARDVAFGQQAADMLHEPVHDRVTTWDLRLQPVLESQLVSAQEVFDHLNTSFSLAVAL